MNRERASGALMGAFIGEALGVGPHWYYDLEEMRRDYGAWIRDYTMPMAGRYHEGLKPGELSQAGLLLKWMAENLIKNKGYDEADFCRMMDEDILPKLDGNPRGGPGGYTSQSMRYLWEKRVSERKTWREVACTADTTEALERNLATAIFYADDLKKLSRSIGENTALTQSDSMVGALTLAFSSVLALLIQGEPLDKDIGIKLMARVKSGELPFHAVTTEGLKPPKPGEPAPSNEGLYASPDALLSAGYMAQAAEESGVHIEPAYKVSIVYGMPCAIYHMLPAAYYLGARFKNDFESGVLHAINGGGQNQVRAMLTGALIGAQVGIQGIPKRLIEGLVEHEALMALADRLAQ